MTLSILLGLSFLGMSVYLFLGGLVTAIFQPNTLGVRLLSIMFWPVFGAVGLGSVVGLMISRGRNRKK